MTKIAPEVVGTARWRLSVAPASSSTPKMAQPVSPLSASTVTLPVKVTARRRKRIYSVHYPPTDVTAKASVSVECRKCSPKMAPSARNHSGQTLSAGQASP